MTEIKTGYTAETHGQGTIIIREYREEDMLIENDELRSLLREILAAYTSGHIIIQSVQTGDPENGIPLRPWHEEWIEGVKEALDDQS